MSSDLTDFLSIWPMFSELSDLNRFLAIWSILAIFSDLSDLSDF